MYNKQIKIFTGIINNEVYYKIKDIEIVYNKHYKNTKKYLFTINNKIKDEELLVILEELRQISLIKINKLIIIHITNSNNINFNTLVKILNSKLSSVLLIIFHPTLKVKIKNILYNIVYDESSITLNDKKFNANDKDYKKILYTKHPYQSLFFTKHNTIIYSNIQYKDLNQENISKTLYKDYFSINTVLNKKESDNLYKKNINLVIQKKVKDEFKRKEIILFIHKNIKIYDINLSILLVKIKEFDDSIIDINNFLNYISSIFVFYSNDNIFQFINSLIEKDIIICLKLFKNITKSHKFNYLSFILILSEKIYNIWQIKINLNSLEPKTIQKKLEINNDWVFFYLKKNALSLSYEDINIIMRNLYILNKKVLTIPTHLVLEYLEIFIIKLCSIK